MTQAAVTADIVSEPADAGQPQETFEQRFEQQLAELQHSTAILESELRGVKSVAQRAETVTQTTNASIASLQEGLEERFAPKRALALLEKTVRGFDNGDELWEQYQRDGEVADLKAKVNAKPKVEPSATPDERQALLSEWNTTHQGTAMNYAATRGVDFTDDLVRGFKHVVQEYPDRWVGWHREWRKYINGIEDAAKKPEAQSQTVIDQSRGGGVPAKDAYAAYQKALKEGGALPSAAEIDRITAEHYRGEM